MVDRTPMSATGALHGSGFATAQTEGSSGNKLLYFQHATGEIRRMERGTDGTWSGGDSSTAVPTATGTNPKNGTPIAIVNYVGESQTWHLFYIDVNNILREKITVNETTAWHDGPLSELNLYAVNDPNAALQACYGGFYSDAAQLIPTQGIHLFWGSHATTVSLYNWNTNDTQWSPDVPMDYTANGLAGIGCYSWNGSDSNWYAMMVDLDNNVNVLYRDAKGVNHHGVFYNSSLQIDNVMVNTSLGFTDHFFAQSADGSLNGYKIIFDQGNTELNTTNEKITISGNVIPGTRFSVTQLPSNLTNGNEQLAVIYQASGDDISIATWDGGNTWSTTALSVPLA
jgi:hypothetical protein